MASSRTTPLVLGLDVGGTKTAAVLGTPEGRIVRREAWPTEAHRPFADTWPGLGERLRALRAEAGAAVRAVSVAVGGPLRIEEGVLLDPPHLPGWHGVPLRARLEEAFPGLPVAVEHDGNAGALAEYHFGAGRSRAGLKHLIFLTFGTGLGAGIVVNGTILRGASDTAGEVGHWRLADDGPVGFGKAGSWEGFASGRGLVLLAARRFPQRWSPDTPIRMLVDAMLGDDPEALAVAEEAGRWMGRGLALLVDAFNPEVIVVGSLGGVLGERVLGPARAVLAAEALPQAVAACRVVPAALGARLGDVAACMAALTHPSLRPLWQ